MEWTIAYCSGGFRGGGAHPARAPPLLIPFSKLVPPFFIHACMCFPPPFWNLKKTKNINVSEHRNVSDSPPPFGTCATIEFGGAPKKKLCRSPPPPPPPRSSAFFLDLRDSRRWWCSEKSVLVPPSPPPPPPLISFFGTCATFEAAWRRSGKNKCCAAVPPPPF